MRKAGVTAAGAFALPRFACGAAAEKAAKIVLIAGPKSHGYMEHEHYAGFALLAKWLEAAGLGIQSVVCKDGWPKDESVFDGAAAIAVNCDGENGHVFAGHETKLDELKKRGVGLAVLHFALIIDKGPLGNLMLEWAGGYDEPDWSVVKWWTAEFRAVPEHPVSRGVKPFTFHDEWYYHMRFRPGLAGVTPILRAAPPDATREGPDGRHSGNPVVRGDKGKAETVAWVSELPNGTRGFGFTGGHSHRYLGHPQFRKVLLNGIAWCARVPIPIGGIVSAQPTLEELRQNQDDPEPANFDFGAITKELTAWKAEDF